MPDDYDFTQKPQRAGTAPQLPILTYLLTALSVLITVAYLQPGIVSSPLWYQIGHFGLADPETTPGSRYWSLVTTVFVHGGWLHLLFNMLWLVQLGRILEATLPPVTYLAVLVGAAVIGSGCELLIPNPTGIPGMVLHTTGIGMSGVVYGMFGLMWAGRGQVPVWGMVATQDNLRILVGWGLFCIVATWLHFMNVANGAHVGGFLFGLSIGFLFFSPRRRWIWAVPLALLAGITLFSVVRFS